MASPLQHPRTSSSASHALQSSTRMELLLLLSRKGDGARRKGPDTARMHSSGQRAALTPKQHGHTPAEAQALQMWIMKPTNVYLQYCTATTAPAIVQLFWESQLFPPSLVLCECTWVLLSLGLLCYYVLFSRIACWQVGTQPVLIFTTKPPDAVAHSTSHQPHTKSHSFSPPSVPAAFPSCLLISFQGLALSLL